MVQEISLGPRLEIRDVEAAHRQLVQAVAGAASVRVDVSRITAVDTAGAQLLLALVREAERRVIGLEFSGKSIALEAALESLGLAEVSARCTSR
ncbi:MAG: STAS domain-containing protein [Steroidobacteraceae bacterium]|jgi:ABC-type transporter Mla MlaB component